MAEEKTLENFLNGLNISEAMKLSIPLGEALTAAHTVMHDFMSSGRVKDYLTKPFTADDAIRLITDISLEASEKFKEVLETDAGNILGAVLGEFKQDYILRQYSGQIAAVKMVLSKKYYVRKLLVCYTAKRIKDLDGTEKKEIARRAALDVGHKLNLSIKDIAELKTGFIQYMEWPDLVAYF